MFLERRSLEVGAFKIVVIIRCNNMLILLHYAYLYFLGLFIKIWPKIVGLVLFVLLSIIYAIFLEWHGLLKLAI